MTNLIGCDELFSGDSDESDRSRFINSFFRDLADRYIYHGIDGVVSDLHRFLSDLYSKRIKEIMNNLRKKNLIEETRLSCHIGSPRLIHILKKRILPRNEVGSFHLAFPTAW